MQPELWDEVRALERRIDDLFREFLGPRPRTKVPGHLGGVMRAFTPTTDVYAQDGELVIRFEIPGVDPDRDVKITIVDDELILRGERRDTQEIEEKAYLRRESVSGAFERHIAIPDGADENTVKADYADGVLEVRLPAPVEGRLEKVKSVPIHTTKTA